MTALKYSPTYTVDDYRQWEGDWELWDGVAVAMSPSPFGGHQKLVAELSYRLLSSIKSIECQGCDVVVELDWIIDAQTVVRPDVAVVCGSSLDRFIDRPPAFMSEVLSPSTAQKDKTAKFQLYQQLSVKYYLIVDPLSGVAELYERSKDGRYEKLDPPSKMQIELHKDCRIELDLTNLV